MKVLYKKSNNYLGFLNNSSLPQELTKKLDELTSLSKEESNLSERFCSILKASSIERANLNEKTFGDIKATFPDECSKLIDFFKKEIEMPAYHFIEIIMEEREDTWSDTLIKFFSEYLSPDVKQHLLRIKDKHDSENKRIIANYNNSNDELKKHPLHRNTIFEKNLLDKKEEEYRNDIKSYYYKIIKDYFQKGPYKFAGEKLSNFIELSSKLLLYILDTISKNKYIVACHLPSIDSKEEIEKLKFLISDSQPLYSVASENPMKCSELINAYYRDAFSNFISRCVKQYININDKDKNGYSYYDLSTFVAEIMSNLNVDMSKELNEYSREDPTLYFISHHFIGDDEYIVTDKYFQDVLKK